MGDVFAQGAHSFVDIGVTNTSGDDNVFIAFNDELTAGTGINTLVGDVYYTGETEFVEINVSNISGDDNVFDMFNDTFNLFNDTLNGGGGADTLFGDFLFESDGEIDLDLTNLALGDDMLFDDVIDGGTGNDDIYGQLGDDILTGGADDDTFFFGTTLDAGSTGVGGITGGIFDGDDTILDYTIADDFVDLEALFDALEALDGAGFDETAERLAALEYADAGSGELELKINDGAGGANGATDDFSITFDNLLFTDFNSQAEQDVLEATFILGGT